MTIEQIAEIIEQIVASVIHDYDLDADIVTQASKLGEDLGMDGGDIHNVVMRCEEVFKIQIPDDALIEKSSVSDLIDIVHDLILRITVKP